jgi:hypothetical protein
MPRPWLTGSPVSLTLPADEWPLTNRRATIPTSLDGPRRRGPPARNAAPRALQCRTGRRTRARPSAVRALVSRGPREVRSCRSGAGRWRAPMRGGRLRSRPLRVEHRLSPRSTLLLSLRPLLQRPLRESRNIDRELLAVGGVVADRNRRPRNKRQRDHVVAPEVAGELLQASRCASATCRTRLLTLGSAFSHSSPLASCPRSASSPHKRRERRSPRGQLESEPPSRQIADYPADAEKCSSIRSAYDCGHASAGNLGMPAVTSRDQRRGGSPGEALLLSMHSGTIAPTTPEQPIRPRRGPTGRRRLRPSLAAGERRRVIAFLVRAAQDERPLRRRGDRGGPASLAPCRTIGIARSVRIGAGARAAAFVRLGQPATTVPASER